MIKIKKINNCFKKLIIIFMVLLLQYVHVYNPIVLIILESFSAEYVGGYNNYKGYTPFLDSLIKQSLVFRNAVSNAERSNKGIVSIMASFPALMDDSFMSSSYQDNQLTGIGVLLKELGKFFHGGWSLVDDL